MARVGHAAILLITGALSPVAHATAGRPIMIQLRLDPDAGRRGAEPAPSQPPRSFRDAEPTQVFTDEQGRTCRTYTREVVIAGEPRAAVATVCREPNGRWVLSR